MDVCRICHRLKPKRLLMSILGVFILVYIVDSILTANILPRIPMDKESIQIRHDFRMPKLVLNANKTESKAPALGKITGRTRLKYTRNSPSMGGQEIAEGAWKPGFQEVAPGMVWVYSAYLDYRVTPPLIRVFGLMNARVAQRAKFQFVFYKEHSLPQDFHNNIGTAFSSDIINIDSYHGELRDYALVTQAHIKNTTDPSAIKAVEVRIIRPTGQRKHLNLLEVIHVKPDENVVKTDFTVCTSPIFFDYDDIGEFVQMVEVGRILGINKFVIYDLAIGKKLVPYVRYYQKLGIVDVLPWDIPRYDAANRKKIHEYIHYFGQVISINDCVYRYMYKTSYIAVLDLDEIIMPLKADTWKGMLQRFEPTAHSFDFRCVFFKKEWPDDQEYLQNLTKTDRHLVQNLNLTVLLKTRRERKLWDHRARSKEIVKPEVVQFYHIHFVYQYMDGYAERELYDVPEEEALLYHYRFWDSSDGAYVVDRKMHQFSNKIIEGAKEAVSKVRKHHS